MTEHYDELETRGPEARERALFAALPQQIAHAKAHAPAFATSLAEVTPEAITSRAALARLPVIRKSEVAALQKSALPFGGLAASKWGAIRRVFASPGPIFEPEGARVDYWRVARALFAAGFRPGDLVHNTFSYHFTPAGSMLETGAHALGCSVIPAGTGQTEQQVQAIAALQPTGYIGTPSFLKIILDKADELGVPLPSLAKALVSGEAFSGTMRDMLAARGIHGYQAYATADLGSIAYESPAREGLIVDEGVIVEIVRPGTGDPVADGEVGEVVVTSVYNTDYPLIRFGTGDMSAVLAGPSPCGRTNMRIKGWLGRADQTTKVKGMFVHPGQVAAIIKRHAGIVRARLIVDNPDGVDRMTLHLESAGADASLQAAVVESIRDVTKLRGEVAIVSVGTLPNDGKVIEDRRKYD